jgi:anti-sigma B factor antagonist
MTHSRSDDGGRTILRIQGALDAVTAPELRPALDQLVAERRMQIVIDLSELSLIDSSGVGAIVSLFKRVRAAGGTVSIVGIREQPLAIFRLLRLDRVFAIDKQR